MERCGKLDVPAALVPMKHPKFIFYSRHLCSG